MAAPVAWGAAELQFLDHRVAGDTAADFGDAEADNEVVDRLSRALGVDASEKSCDEDAGFGDNFEGPFGEGAPCDEVVVIGEQAPSEWDEGGTYCQADDDDEPSLHITASFPGERCIAYSNGLAIWTDEDRALRPNDMAVNTVCE